MSGLSQPRLADTRLVSNSAPTWSSRCRFTAGHFSLAGKSLGRNAIRVEPN